MFKSSSFETVKRLQENFIDEMKSWAYGPLENVKMQSKCFLLLKKNKQTTFLKILRIN